MLLVAAVLASLAAEPGASQPSRAASKGCAWKKVSDQRAGLEAWVQHCDYGFRTVDFAFEGSALMMRYSDGGTPYPVVEVFPMAAGEQPETAVGRVFASRTAPGVASRCVLAPYDQSPAPRGVRRFTFVPKPDYQKELDAKASPDEVPDPPCGELGIAPDAVQYFEAHPTSTARKVLFVRIGQDEPLFDEQTLRLLLR